jgi:hypothetical protein
VDIKDAIRGDRSEILYDLDWDSYRALPGVSPSSIVKAEKSLKHFKYGWDNPRPDTDDLSFGTATHAILFEPDTYDDRFTTWKTRRQGKKYDEFLANAKADGKMVLTSYQAWAVEQCGKAFKADSEVQDLLRVGKPEVSVMAAVDGCQCRGRMDWLGNAIVDLKTTKALTARSFGRDFYEYGYDLKLASYREFVTEVTGEIKPVILIVIEKEPPFDLAVLPIPEPVLDRGWRKASELIAKIRQAVEDDYWPGVGGDFYLDTPTWEMDDLELEGAIEA